ncbi:MAG TPA: FAD-dependent oxidoreductase [Lapillicoccus sp.]|nr:FAD-dependent oxidoreductase [Lapillicoccus sp.]
MRHPGPSGRRRAGERHHAVVVGGGIAGLAAATGLAERGVEVTLVEAAPTLGGRVRAWPIAVDGAPTTMSRGFHAFFRQYYNLRALLRRADPTLARLRPVADYPLVLAGGHTDSFAGLPTRPPFNLMAFVARSPSFTARDLARVDADAALGLLDVSFPRTYDDYAGRSAAEVLDELRFPDGARHLALEVFARSFFADPRDFSGGELVAMFHTYFLGSAEGLLFDVPYDDYDTALWAPLGRYLEGLGVRVVMPVAAMALEDRGDRLAVVLEDGSAVEADAVVVATDQAPLQRLVATSPAWGDEPWRTRVAERRSAPAFAVWRLWFDGPVRAGTPPFLATSGFGPLDNVSAVHQFESGASRWARARNGSVVEVHAYALPGGTDEAALRAELRNQLHDLHPELDPATVLHEEWLVRDDCPLVGTEPWRDRPEVATPDPRIALAGDGIRCDYPVALMERAATTGWMAANHHLTRWGLPGHDLWTVPMTGRHRAVPPLRRLLAQAPKSSPRERSR